MILRIQNIEKHYDRPVLQGVTHEFQAGKLYVIKGVSGCGKSTLLNILGGVERDFGGSLRWDDGKAHRAAYIFQSSLLISRLTLLENLELFCGDPRRIRSLCQRLGIEALLEKYPEQLSGGERQRAAIARALLREPELVLADEPTASLDGENSQSIAALMAELRRAGRIMIVATHEDCFDEYADEILYLDYGRLRRGEETEERTPEPEQSRAEPPKAPRLHPFRYALRHKPELLRLKKLLALAFAFLLVLLVFTLRTNFSAESAEFLKDRYPMDLVPFYRNSFDAFPHKELLTVYEDYQITEEGVTGLYLMPEKDSVFGIRGMIQAGRFPETPTEVLVNPPFLRARFPEAENPDACLGKQIAFGGERLTVAGVTAELTEGKAERFSAADLYYRRRVEGPCLFLPYESIRALGEKQDNEFLMTVCEGMSESPELLELMTRWKEGEGPNQFYGEIKDIRQLLDLAVWALFGVLVVVYGMCCVFLVTVVHTELFSRKRELGYLQIFGLSRFRVLRLILAEYLLKLGGALLLALTVFGAVFGLYCLILGRGIALDPFALPAIFLLCALYLLSALGSAGVFLKQSPHSLITDGRPGRGERNRDLNCRSKEIT